MRKPAVLIGLGVLGMITIGTLSLRQGMNQSITAAADSVAALSATKGQGSGGRAVADLRDGEGRVVGTATLRSVDQGVEISVEVKGLSAGRHGFHIHEKGLCEAPAFTSAGGHFNPSSREHGMENPAGVHAGDLPNIVVGADGTGSLTTINPYLTLGTGAANDLLREGGTSVMIHAGPDDYFTDPAGDSGARIVCGVVERVRG